MSNKAKQNYERMVRLSHLTIEQAPSSIFWVDSTSRIVHVNEATCTILGYSREELIDKMVPAFDVDIAMDEWGKFWTKLKQKQYLNFDSHQRTKDGRVFPVNVNVHFIEFEGTEYCCAFTRDITERIKTEQDMSSRLKTQNFGVIKITGIGLQIQTKEKRLRFW